MVECWFLLETFGVMMMIFAKVLDEVSLVTTTYNLHEIETLFKIISIDYWSLN